MCYKPSNTCFLKVAYLKKRYYSVLENYIFRFYAHAMLCLYVCMPCEQKVLYKNTSLLRLSFFKILKRNASWFVYMVCMYVVEHVIL